MLVLLIIPPGDYSFMNVKKDFPNFQEETKAPDVVEGSSVDELVQEAPQWKHKESNPSDEH